MKNLLEDIKDIKAQNVDFTIMYMHSGGQYNPGPTEYTKKLSSYLISNGIDIIAGSHEHVVHGGDFSRKNEGKLVTYSLGNFVGIAGVYSKPFDKMAEYSIAWNIYLDDIKKKIIKTTFSVMKTIELYEKKIQTVPVYDLIYKNNGVEKEKLIADALYIAKVFSGQSYQEVQKEFIIALN